MKRIFLLAVCIALLLPVGAIAFDGSYSSGEQTSSAAIVASAGWLAGVEVITDGTNDAKLILYDNATAASGTVLLEMTVNGGDNYGGRYWIWPVHFYNGVYAAISGTGASYIVEYMTE